MMTRPRASILIVIMVTSALVAFYDIYPVDVNNTDISERASRQTKQHGQQTRHDHRQTDPDDGRQAEQNGLKTKEDDRQTTQNGRPTEIDDRQEKQSCQKEILLQRSYQTHLTEDQLISNRSVVSSVKYDIPKQFNSSFLNPCWYDSPSSAERTLKCLPYYFLAGFIKCGTSDLYHKMRIHPQIRLTKPKEHHWWNTRRFPDLIDSWQNLHHEPLSAYVNVFKDLAKNLDSMNPQSEQLRFVTGDGSATTLWDNRRWFMFPGNEDADEPRVLTADHIRHYLPESKIIVIVRDPVDRLLSHYTFYWNLLVRVHGEPSAEDFHNRVTKSISNYKDCLRKHPVRTCVYASRNIKKEDHDSYLDFDSRVGMYSIYLKDWYCIFPKQQIHVLRTEDLASSPERELKKIFNFLELEPLPDSAYKALQSMPKLNSQTGSRSHISMLHKTETMLREFYAPYNAELAQLLNNNDYLWN